MPESSSESSSDSSFEKSCKRGKFRKHKKHRNSSDGHKHSHRDGHSSSSKIYKRGLCMDIEEIVPQRKEKSSLTHSSSKFQASASFSKFQAAESSLVPDRNSLVPVPFVAWLPANLVKQSCSSNLPIFGCEQPEMLMSPSMRAIMPNETSSSQSQRKRKHSAQRSSSEEFCSGDSEKHCFECQKKKEKKAKAREQKRGKRHRLSAPASMGTTEKKSPPRSSRCSKSPSPGPSRPKRQSSATTQRRSSSPGSSWVEKTSSPRAIWDKRSSPDLSWSKTKRQKQSFSATNEFATPPFIKFQNKQRLLPKSAPAKMLKPQSTLQCQKSLTLRSYYSESGFIDSHCHLDFLFQRIGYDGSHADFMKKKDYPVSYRGCISVFCEPSIFKKRSIWRRIIDDDNIWGAFGCHPHHANAYTDEVEEDLKAALFFDKTIALGEIGLDFSSRNGVSVETQVNVFRRQLKLLNQFPDKPLIIHCRQAHDMCYPIVKEEVAKDHPIHLHCFTDDWQKAQLWLDTFPKLCIGITNLITKPEAKVVHEIAKNIPLNRLLVETDAPYFVPTELKSQEQESHPGMAIFVAAEISNIKNITLEETLEAIMNNTRMLYNI